VSFYLPFYPSKSVVAPVADLVARRSPFLPKYWIAHRWISDRLHKGTVNIVSVVDKERDRAID
jgi:hypothetical protein